MTGKNSVSEVWTPHGETLSEHDITEKLLIYALCPDEPEGTNHYHLAIHNLFAPLGFEVLGYNDTNSFLKDFDYTVPSLVIIRAHPMGWRKYLAKSEVKYIDGSLELSLLARNRNCPPVIVFTTHEDRSIYDRLQAAIWGEEGESNALVPVSPTGKINTNDPIIKKHLKAASDFFKDTLDYPNGAYLPAPFNPDDLKQVAFDLMPYAYFAAQKTLMDKEIEVATDKLDKELYDIWLDRVKGLTAAQSANNFHGYETADIEYRRKKINRILEVSPNNFSRHIDLAGTGAEILVRRQYTEEKYTPPKRHKPKPTPPKTKLRKRGPKKK